MKKPTQYEYRSRMICDDGGSHRNFVETTMNEWAQDGWEVFSVVCPDSGNYSTYRLSARRDVEWGEQTSIRRIA